MGKTYSKAQLLDKAKAVFENYLKAEQVFATTDGNIFLSDNRARLHAGPKGEVVTINRFDTIEVEAVDIKPTSADDLIAAAKTMSLEEAELALTVEEGLKKPRKTVVKAYQKRVEELKTND